VKRTASIIVLAFGVVIGPVHGASGTFRTGSTSTDLAQSVESGWNVGQWFCRTGFGPTPVGAPAGRR
jgi:hypothetical protein